MITEITRAAAEELVRARFIRDQVRAAGADEYDMSTRHALGAHGPGDVCSQCVQENLLRRQHNA